MIDRLISRKAFAEALTLSMRSFARLEKRGGLPPRVTLPGRRIGYREREAQAFIDALPTVEEAKRVTKSRVGLG
jgi:predicted DNA-binding transcriptional regulator AlpA